MGKGRYRGRRAAAFIFDLDGTLIDSGQDIAASANFTRVHFGLPELPVKVVRSYVGDGVAKLLTRALGHDHHTGLTGEAGLPVSPERHAEAMGVFADHYERHLLDTTRLYPGVLEMLARFRQFPLFVATNKPQAFSEKILGGLKVADAFVRIVGGDVPEARKPDPRHLAATLAGHHLDPAEVAMIGDSPNDVHAAQAFGAMSVGCTFGLVPPAIIRAAQPDFLIDRFDQLADLFPSRTS